MNYIAKSFPPLTGIRIEFRDAADNSPALIWMAGEDGLCNWFNRGWLEFTGRTIEQEIGNGWLEGVHSQDLQPCIDQYLKHFNAREHFLLEYRLRRFDGQYRWILDSGTPVFDPEGAFLGYNGVCFDINERKEAENEALIAATVFESQEGMMVTDANRLIIKVNAAFTAITGYSLDDVKGKDPRLLKSGQHDDAFYASMWKNISSEGYWEGKIWNRRKNGEVYPEQLTITSVKNASGIVTNYVATLTDFSRQEQVEGALKDSEKRFRTMFEQAPLGVALIDSFTGHIYEVNTKFASIAGRSLPEMSNIDWMSITHPDDVQEDLDNMARLNAMTIPGFSMNKRYIRPDGSYVWINMAIAPLVEKDGTHKQHLCMIEDISERKQLEFELTTQAHLDYLTGLSNRRHFMAQGEVELSRAKRYNNALSVLMLDIDLFKNVNDTYGHQVGDIVLQELAKVCQSTLRQVDIAGRLGGEEFAIILPEAEAKEAFEVAERLRQMISKMEVNKPDGLPIHFTVSIGVTSLQDKNVNIDMLLNQADKALYEAKQTGRNKVCVG
jgi:diguanylate cyclase (GGDEF)-like protein/PAS domain S-box-containing protein